MREFVIGVRITASSDVAALEAARKAMGAVNAEQLKVINAQQKSAAAMGSSGGIIGKAVGVLKNSFLGYAAAALGASAANKLFRQSIEEFSVGEQRLTNLRATMAVFDRDAKLTAEDVHAWSGEIQKLTQVNDDLVDSLVTRLLPTTESVSASMYLARLAAMAQKAGWMDAENAANALSAAMLGRVRKGADQLSVTLYRGKVSGEDFAITLGKLEEAATKAGDRQLTAAEQLKKTELQRADAVEAMGRQTARLAIAFEPVKKYWTIFQAMFVGGLIKAAAYIKYAATSTAGWGKVLWEVAKGPMGDVKKVWADFKQDLVLSEQDIANAGAAAQALMDEVWDAFDETPNAVAARRKLVEEEGRAAAIAAQRRLQDARDREEAADAVTKAGQAVADTIKSQIDLEKKLEEAGDQTAASKQRSYEKIVTLLGQLEAAQLAAIDMELKAATEKAENNAALIEAAEKEAGSKRLAIINATSTAILDAERLVTEAVLQEAIDRATAIAVVEEQQAQAAIARNDARIAALKAESENVFTSPERVLAIETQITAINAETLAIRLNNIERQKRNALEIADLNKATPEQKAVIAGKFDQDAKDADAAAAQVVTASANEMDARLKHLLSYGEAADAERKRQLAADLAAINERLDAVKAGSDEEKALLASRNALQKTANAEQVQAALGQAAAVIGVLQGAFPESKALASASAFINMISGAVAALAPPPTGLGPVAGIPLAAATVAAGMMNIAKINSTDPKSGAGSGGMTSSQKAGFDNPRNDAAAMLAGYRGSVKWADDMISKYNEGIDRGWADRMAQAGTVDQRTVVNDHSRGNEIHQHLTYLWGPQTREEATKAARVVDAGRRRSTRSRIGSGAAKLGGS